MMGEEEKMVMIVIRMIQDEELWRTCFLFISSLFIFLSLNSGQKENHQHNPVAEIQTLSSFNTSSDSS